MRQPTRFIGLLFGTAFAFTALLVAVTAAAAQTPAAPPTQQAGACPPARTAIEAGVWLTATVDDSAAVEPNLAVIAPPTGDAITIAYFDAARHELRLAEGYTSSWQLSSVTAIGGGLTGRYPSLDLDALGRPHIAFVTVYTPTFDIAQGKALYYARRDGAGWHIEEIQPETDAQLARYAGGPTALQLVANQPEATPHLLYRRQYLDVARGLGTTLWHATGAGGGSTRQNVDGGLPDFASHLSLVRGPGGMLYAAYNAVEFNGWSSSEWRGVVVAANVGSGGWTTEWVDGDAPVSIPGSAVPEHVADAPALAVDAAGRVHMSYVLDGSLALGQRTATGWITSTVAGADAALDTALALTPCNHPLVAYGDSAGQVRVALWDGFGWRHETVGNGMAPAVVMAGGAPVIAYYHAPTHSLRVAWRTTVTLDPVGYLPLVMGTP